MASDQSGYSVSLNSNGNIVAIGSPYNDDNGSNSGSVRVYENDNGTWTQIGADIDGEMASDQSGYSVSLNSNGNIVAIGSPYNDDNGSNSGSVRVYENDNGTWTQIGADIDGEMASDQSGTSVSLNSNGNIVAIGAYENDGNDFFRNASGHVRVYENDNGTWTQIGDDIDGEAEVDSSGKSVSLNSNGNIVAIGAYRNDGNGIYSGHVRVYENDNGTWTQIGADIDGEMASDQSGYSVSLNSNGNIVAIGSPYNDDNGSNSGSVRIYEFPSEFIPTPTPIPAPSATPTPTDTPTPVPSTSNLPSKIYINWMQYVDGLSSNIPQSALGEYTLKPSMYFSMNMFTAEYYENEYGYKLVVHAYTNPGESNSNLHELWDTNNTLLDKSENNESIFSSESASYYKIQVCKTESECSNETPTPIGSDNSSNDPCTDAPSDDVYYVEYLGSQVGYDYYEGFYAYDYGGGNEYGDNEIVYKHTDTSKSTNQLIVNFGYQSTQYGWGIYASGTPMSGRTNECDYATDLNDYDSDWKITWCSAYNSPQPRPSNCG